VYIRPNAFGTGQNRAPAFRILPGRVRGVRSNDHYYDSVDYALIVEGDDVRLYWPKHILQHAFVRFFYSIQHALGHPSRALPLAQVLNAVAGAGAVSLFFALVAGLTSDAWLSACFAIVLGFSAAVARHAVEGEAYMLPLLFFTTALLIASRAPSRPATALLGAAQAASVLMHQSYVLFIPPLGFYLVLRGGVRGLWPWLTAAALPIIAVYGAVFAAKGLPARELYHWLYPEGAAAAIGQAEFFDVGRSLLHGFSPSENQERAVSPVKLLAPSIAVAFAIGLRPAWGKHPRELALCAAIAALYVPALIWYGGPTFQYCPPLIVAVLLAAALCVHAGPQQRATRLVTTGYTLVFAAASIALTLVPAHRRNDSMDRADFAAKVARPLDRIVVLGAGNSGNDPTYFPYFARRGAISLWQLECCSDPARELLDELDELIDRTLLRGDRVFVFDSAIARGDRLPNPWGGRLSIGGDALRGHLDERYRLVDRHVYAGRGYSERLLEIEKLSCGPAPHFKSVGAACLPSCGVLLNELGAAPSTGACCPRGCGPSARVLGRAWDCEACCRGEAPLCR
jgi:hypothetical protein